MCVQNKPIAINNIFKITCASKKEKFIKQKLHCTREAIVCYDDDKFYECNYLEEI